MARRNTSAARRGNKRTNTTVKVDRPEEKTTESNGGLFEKIQYDLQHNQSYLNLILGGLIVVVLGVLVYNYFNKPNTDLNTPEPSATTEQTADVAKEDLPGSYTVKEGDTLFTIAQKYYGDGYKYSEIVKTNTLKNENSLEVGQIITIPKLETASSAPAMDASTSPEASMDPTMSMEPSSSPSDTQSMNNQVAPSEKGAPTGGAVNMTMWGDKISSNTYTVRPGDWLSKIAGRAYGDVMQYQKIAQANNISNPDSIEVGTVLKLPR